MKTAVHFSIIPILMLCCAASAWVQMEFCKKHLGCTKAKERIFLALYFIGIIAAGVTGEKVYIPFIIYAMLCHFSFAILVILLFDAGVEKKILGAVLLIGIKTLAGNFADSLLSAVVLVFFHVWKKESAVYIGIWGSYLIGSLSLAASAALIGFLSGPLSSIFWNKMKKWYIILAVPLIFIILVIDIVNFGASNGIMVVSDVNGPNYWNVYYNQLFSHIAMCIIMALSMCAAGFYVFGMDKFMRNRGKKSNIDYKLNPIKCWKNSMNRWSGCVMI